MHICGDLLLPCGHRKGFCGDCVEAALVADRLEGRPSLELWALGARADDDQKHCELRQG